MTEDPEVAPEVKTAQTDTRASEAQIQRVRQLCLSLPETTEQLSHGEPTFFVRKKVFVMFSNNHHNDGRVAVWIPAPFGLQAELIATAPEVYFRPPYVGVKGWVGIEVSRVNEVDLSTHIRQAWRMVAPRQLRIHQSAKI
jgi:hypothetical protein